MKTRSQALVTGWQVFWWITGFFAVIIAVNFTMAVLALSTFNGVSDDQAYVDGLEFNQKLEAVARQKALGWTVDTQIKRPGDLGAHIQVSYADSSETPLTQLTVHAEFVRPVHEGYDFSIPLRQTAPGVYTAKTEVPLSGQWTVRMVAEPSAVSGKSQAMPYILTYRTVIR